MLQNATPVRKSAPWPPNVSDEHISCTAPATRNASLQILFKCPTPAIVFWKCYKTLTFCSLLRRCTIPCACHAKAHLNVQKCSVPVSFLHFWLRNVLRATSACNFSSLIWPDGSAPPALASLLFDPPEPQIIGKTQRFATFLPFRASASSSFWLFLFSDLLSSTPLFSLTLPISAFHLSILPEVWLLNFLW